MMWLALLPLAAVVLWLWYPRPAPRSPFPSVTDTVAGFADRTRGERLTEHSTWTDVPTRPNVYDWTTDDGPDAA